MAALASLTALGLGVVPTTAQWTTAAAFSGVVTMTREPMVEQDTWWIAATPGGLPTSADAFQEVFDFGSIVLRNYGGGETWVSEKIELFARVPRDLDPVHALHELVSFEGLDGMTLNKMGGEDFGLVTELGSPDADFELWAVGTYQFQFEGQAPPASQAFDMSMIVTAWPGPIDGRARATGTFVWSEDRDEATLPSEADELDTSGPAGASPDLAAAPPEGGDREVGEPATGGAEADDQEQSVDEPADEHSPEDVTDDQTDSGQDVGEDHVVGESEPELGPEPVTPVDPEPVPEPAPELTPETEPGDSVLGEQDGDTCGACDECHDCEDGHCDECDDPSCPARENESATTPKTEED